MRSLSSLANGWAALSPMLDEALGLPLHERHAWLERLSGERAEHRETLRALLEQQAVVETDDFLNQLPQLHTAASDPSYELAEGSRVGVYRLIREVGRGGMGTVWLAERADGTMRRRVALKLPRIVWGDTFAERLAREREILATLEHEHIARLYDGGVDAQGRPFLAMEYVEGQAIDTYCRERALSVRERIELLLQVAGAVAHAHARLVVHRDLKPGNILVTQDGRVHLLDFGIAKLLEGDLTSRTALTDLVGRAFTLDFASPEQIRGEPLGIASDVYSLAVVAYDLLAGSRPYRLKRASAAELEEAIASVEPPPASSVAVEPRISRQLRGDIDSILNKALKKLPGERYQTMDAFAQDWRRYLAGQPVEARPDRLAYRARKFVGRYRLQVGAGCVVGATLIAGTTVALWQANKATIEAQRARLANRFVANLFSQNDPDALQGRQMTGAEMLQAGAEKLDSEFKDQPEALGDLHLLVGKIYVSISSRDEARKHLDSALAIFRRLGDVPSALDALAARGEVAALDGDATQQRQLAQAGMEEARRYAGDESRWHTDFASLLAQAAWTEGKFDEAERWYAVTLRGEARRHGERSSEWLEAQDGMALVYIQTGRLLQARDALAEAERIGSAIPGLPPRRLLSISYDLALVRGMLGDLVGEEAELSRIVPEYERQLGPLHREPLTYKMEWTRVLAELGRYEAAVAFGREALEQLPRSELSADEQESMRTLIAWVLWSAGRTAEALPIALQADRYFEGSKSKLGWLAVASKRASGDLLLASGRAPEALPLLQLSLARGAAFDGALNSPRYAAMLISTGLAYRATHQLESAEATIAQACAIYRTMTDGNPRRSLRCEAILAWVRAERSSRPDAAALAAFAGLRSAVERSLPPQHPLGAELLEIEASLLDASGETAKARPMHVSAHQRYKAAVGTDLPPELFVLH